MQPNQQQSVQPTPEEWQQPTAATPGAPYAPVAEAEMVEEPAGQQPEHGPEATDEPVDAQQEQYVDDAEFAEDGTDEDNVSYDDESDEALVRWQGSEYLHHDQTKLWYIVLAVVTIVLMILAIVLMDSITFALLIPVMAVTLVIYTRRPPAINDYTLSRKGLHINDKLFPYSQFRSFSVVAHNGANAAVLVPRKRFQIAQTVYFPEEVGEAVVDMLAARLPMKEGGLDAIDKLLAKLHL